MTRERKRVSAAFWWQGAGKILDDTIRYYIEQAQKAGQDETGHDCGHRFEITVRSTLHVSGPEEHTDADYDDACNPVTVRAHNLRDALLVAATLPLGDWFEEDGEPIVLPPVESGASDG